MVLSAHEHSPHILDEARDLSKTSCNFVATLVVTNVDVVVGRSCTHEFMNVVAALIHLCALDK